MMKKVMNKKKYDNIWSNFSCSYFSCNFSWKEKYVYPTKVEKLSFKESKCGILAQNKTKSGAKK